MARSVYILEVCSMSSGAQADGSNRVLGVYATLKKAQQSAEKSAWPLPPGQALTWKDYAKNPDEEEFHATVTAKSVTRYSITRHHVH